MQEPLLCFPATLHGQAPWEPCGQARAAGRRERASNGVGALNLFSCPKGGSDSGWLQQKCQASVYGWRAELGPWGAHGRAAGSLLFWTRPRWASRQCGDRVQPRILPRQPRVPTLLGNTAPESSGTACPPACSARLRQVPNREGPCWESRTPRSLAHPLCRRGHELLLKGWCGHSPCPPHGTSQQPARKEVLSQLFFLISIL